jgi:uncharacterized protein with PQ loop repeat
MSLVILPVVVTTFLLLVTLTGYYFTPKGKDQQIVRVMIVMTSFCVWLLWALAYLMQCNPILGPQINSETVKKLAELK